MVTFPVASTDSSWFRSLFAAITAPMSNRVAAVRAKGLPCDEDTDIERFAGGGGGSPVLVVVVVSIVGGGAFCEERRRGALCRISSSGEGQAEPSVGLDWK